ncbi:MAG: hypothetical protein IPI49_33570 [Myxococcales bacterium]|nr:hypothetical protein [Myxococcales bacterium]
MAGAIALHCSAYPSGALALSGQALLFASIWKVTGIPATEGQALRSRSEAYRRYPGDDQRLRALVAAARAAERRPSSRAASRS